MDVNHAVFSKQIFHYGQTLVNHGEERVSALSPRVAVGDFFEDVGLLGEGVAADLDVHTEIRADIEGRVDVDQLDAALGFDLLTQRAVLERRQDQLVVTPDQLVRPALELAAAAVEVEEAKLQLRVLLGPRLVDLLDYLKGQDDIADLVGLAVPDQLDLALALEEQEAVLVRQFPVRFEVADDLLFFRVAQS